MKKIRNIIAFIYAVFLHRAPVLRSKKKLIYQIKCLSSEDINTAIDLGCGENLRNVFNAKKIFGLDIRSDVEIPNVHQCNFITEPLPFKKESINAITAYDVLEHVPRVDYSVKGHYPFVNLMNEIYRVLLPGGYFLSSTPCYPHKAAFQDPTHVNIMTEDTLRLYFTNDCWASMYGFIGKFVIIGEGWVGASYWCILKKI